MTKRTRIAIHATLLVLIGAPLHYYVANRDARDERFAWRMFSPIRNEKCSTQFLLGPNRRPVKTSRYVHPAWAGLARRGRQQIIEAIGERICEQNPGQELRIRVQCETNTRPAKGHRAALLALFALTPKGSTAGIEVVAQGLFNFCSTGAL